MKVKVGDKIHDSNEEPIMLIFESTQERTNIAAQVLNMEERAKKYCLYPNTSKWSDNDFEGIKKWMGAK